MSPIRETSSKSRNGSETIVADPALVPSILTPSDTMLVVIGFGVFAILLILVTCI